MNDETKKKLLAALCNIRDNGPALQDAGICGNARLHTDFDSFNALVRIFVRLNLDPYYPLGDAEFFISGNKWEGERGEKRKTLLNECIALLESDLKQP